MATFKTGDVIRGEAVVLAVKGNYVLCAMPGREQPFVTWWISPEGETLSGAYFDELGDGIRSLALRSGV